MLNFIKSHMKFIIGALVGAFLSVAAMTQTNVDDTIGKYLSDQTGIVVTVSPTTVVTPSTVE